MTTESLMLKLPREAETLTIGRQPTSDLCL